MNPSAHFSVEAHVNPSGIRGVVTYRDVAAGVRFQSTELASLTIVGDTATITGTGRADREQVTFVVTATDSSTDRFSIQLSNGYAAASTLRSGNIVVDDRCD